MRKRFFYYCMCCHAFYNECHSFCGRNSGKLFGDGENNDIWNNSDSINFWIITTFCWNVKFLFGTNDTVATSALGSFTISSTSVPSGSTISKIVVTSTKVVEVVETSNYLLLKMRIMEMAHLTDIQTAKVGIVLLLLQILAIII